MGWGAARCPPCSQNAHDETVLVRCAQLRAALATPLTRDEENWKALARVNGTSRRASGWAGEKVARNRDHSRPLALRLLPAAWGGTKGEDGAVRMTSTAPRARTIRMCSPGTRARLGALRVGRVRMSGAVEVTLTTPVLFWASLESRDQGYVPRH